MRTRTTPTQSAYVCFPCFPAFFALLLRVVGFTFILLFITSGYASAQDQTVVILEARLSGVNEVPGPGDADGFGLAEIQAVVSSRTIRFGFEANQISLPIAAAHIHRGAAGEAGPIVIPLLTTPDDVDGAVSGTVTVEQAVFNDLINTPEHFYINVHTSDYPDGAVRGQLVQTPRTIGPGPLPMPSPPPPPPPLPATGETSNGFILIVAAALAMLTVGVGLRRHLH